MNKCSKCGGDVVKLHHLVKRNNGAKSGTYNCKNCGARKNWRTPGFIKENIIDMEELENE